MPDAAQALTFTVRGSAGLNDLEHGDLPSEKSFKGTTRRAWHGRCLDLIQAGRESGEVVLEVTAEGLPPAHLIIR